MKLVLAVILSTCVAYSAGAGCDLLQRFKVKNQWSRAFGSGHHRLEFGVKIFTSLFHKHPETRAMFSRVNGTNPYSPEFQAHTDRVFGSMDMTVGLMDDEDALIAQLAHVKDQHATRNMKPEYYAWLGEELFQLIPQELGVTFDYGAWNECFQILTAGLA